MKDVSNTIENVIKKSKVFNVDYTQKKLNKIAKKMNESNKYNVIDFKRNYGSICL